MLGCSTEFMFAWVLILFGADLDITRVSNTYIVKSKETQVVTVWEWYPEHQRYCFKQAEGS